jgi:hypothetical protein
LFVQRFIHIVIAQVGAIRQVNRALFAALDKELNSGPKLLGQEYDSCRAEVQVILVEIVGDIHIGLVERLRMDGSVHGLREQPTEFESAAIY